MLVSPFGGPDVRPSQTIPGDSGDRPRDLVTVPGVS